MMNLAYQSPYSTMELQALQGFGFQQPEVENLVSGGRWYQINPAKLFSAHFRASDYNNGACNG